MRIVCVLLCLLSTPAMAQDRKQTEAKATLALWSGISMAGGGVATTISFPKMGVPLMMGGGGLIYWAFRLNSKAKSMPSVSFTPKGFQVGYSRSW